MNVENNNQPTGSLKISQDVLATIANFASEEIDGVVSLANTYAPIKSLLKRGSIGRPIQISLNDDVAVIDISVNLKYGANIPQVAEALQKLYDEGFGTIICQPTHVMNGFEFDDVRQEVARWEDRFPHIICGWPLLTSFEDYRLVVDALLKEFNEIARDDSTALVLMGHGTDHPANATYPALDYRLKAEGCRNFFIGTVEGYPDLQTVMKEVASIHAKKVVLAPLMVVAGDHAINDMCTDEDSWLHLFEQAGYQTEAILKGLGEYPSFRQIYLKHCTDCIQHLEEEKSKNR